MHDCLTRADAPSVSSASFTSRESWRKTLPNTCLSAQCIWFLINMNRITSHAEFTLVCVACVVSICGCVCVLVCVCVYVEFHSNVSPKAPLCSLLHISPITTPISVALFHFSFSLHPSVTTPLLPAFSATSPSLPPLSFHSLARSVSLTHSGSECGTWGPLCGFFLRCCYLVAVIMKAGARDGGMKGWRDGVLFCDGCQWVH